MSPEMPFEEGEKWVMTFLSVLDTCNREGRNPPPPPPRDQALPGDL